MKTITFEDTKMYTNYGKRRFLGILANINNKRALAYVEKGEIIAYTFIDEIDRESFVRKLPEFNIDF